MPKIIEVMPGQIAVTDPSIRRPEQAILSQLFDQHDKFMQVGGEGFRPDILMPYSFSTIAAGAIAGCFSREQAFEYARVRANFVRTTEAKKPEEERTAMAIIIGTGETVSQLASKFHLELTNDNFSVQVVAGKARDLAGMAREAGRNFKGFLTAEGTYHSEQRREDSNQFAEYLRNEEFRKPTIPLISSTEPRLLETAEEVKEELSGLMHRKIVLLDMVRGLANYIKEGTAEQLGVLSEHLFVDISPESTMVKLLGKRFPVRINIMDMYNESLASVLNAFRTNAEPA